MKTPPETLNGYPVIQTDSRGDGETHVVLCWRKGQRDMFVTALWSIHSPNEWLHGHYFDSIVPAAQDYASRCHGF